MNRTIFILAFVFTSFTILSQEAIHNVDYLEGKVVDSLTLEAVPFLHIYLPETRVGTTTDEDGLFSLDLSGMKGSQEMIVSGVGYATLVITISDLKARKGLIKIRTNAIHLEAISIYSDDRKEIPAKRLLERSLKKLNQRVPAFVANARLYHVIKENNHFTYGHTAAVQVRDRVGYGKLSRPEYLNEEVSLIDEMETSDFSFNRIFHERSYFDTYVDPRNFLLRNGLKYELVNHDFEYYFSDTTYMGNQLVYVLTAKHLDTARQGLESGFIEVFDMNYYMTQDPTDQYTMNIEAYELNYRSSYDLPAVFHSEVSTFRVNLEPANNGKNYKPSSITLVLNQTRMWKSATDNSQMLSSYHQVDFDEVVFDKNLSSLGDTEKASPIPEDVVQDLHISDLFTEELLYQRIDDPVQKGLIDQLEILKIEYLLERNDSSYLIFWDNHETLLAHQKLLMDADLALKNLIFISGKVSRADWAYILSGAEFSKYYHFNLSERFDDLRKVYCEDQGLPLYVRISPDGNISCQSQPDYFIK